MQHKILRLAYIGNNDTHIHPYYTVLHICNLHMIEETVSNKNPKEHRMPLQKWKGEMRPDK